LLGNDLYERILATQDVPLSDLSPEEQQALLMTLVPKQIGQLVVDQGWRTETVRNLRYGGGLHAPMVTWIINFVDDPRARTTRNTVYRESLRALFVGCAQIEEDGDMSPLLP
jgi:hypothetical protein